MQYFAQIQNYENVGNTRKGEKIQISTGMWLILFLYNPWRQRRDLAFESLAKC